MLPSVRPPGPPKVWCSVERVDPQTKTPKTYTIQEIPEDRRAEVIDFMCTYFVYDEPLCSSLNAKDDPLFIADYTYILENILEQGIAVGMFTNDSKSEKPLLVGANMIYVESKDHEKQFDMTKLKSPLSDKIIGIVIEISKKANIYERYNVDKYMNAFGLCVHPLYRGQALGQDIVRVREMVGREYNIAATSTVFTWPPSQKAAARNGFEVVLEKKYKDIIDEKGNEIFPNIKAEDLKIMGRKLY
ncbi:hypothetical protein KM043_013268 [Ampulex compressa]|nr:hypothetical protein KM043_013268 [Ampulex compressa]